MNTNEAKIKLIEGNKRFVETKQDFPNVSSVRR